MRWVHQYWVNKCVIESLRKQKLSLLTLESLKLWGTMSSRPNTDGPATEKARRPYVGNRFRKRTSSRRSQSQSPTSSRISNRQATRAEPLSWPGRCANVQATNDLATASHTTEINRHAGLLLHPQCSLYMAPTTNYKSRRHTTRLLPPSIRPTGVSSSHFSHLSPLLGVMSSPILVIAGRRVYE